MEQVTTRKVEEEMVTEQVEAVDLFVIEEALEHYPVATTAENATEVDDDLGCRMEGVDAKTSKVNAVLDRH